MDGPLIEETLYPSVPPSTHLVSATCGASIFTEIQGGCQLRRPSREVPWVQGQEQLLQTLIVRLSQMQLLSLFRKMEGALSSPWSPRVVCVCCLRRLCVAAEAAAASALILLCRKVYQVVVVDDAALLYRHGSLLWRKFVTYALQMRKGLEWSRTFP